MEENNLTLVNDSKQHVQVPNGMGMNQGFTPYDILVYSNIKRFMNSKTKKAFPSISKLLELIGGNRNKICRSINKMKGKCFDLIKEGGKNVYIFSKKYKSFEPFSYEFLDKEDLTSDEKAYVLAAQQYMYKNIEGLGKLSFSAEQLSKLINLSKWDIYRLNKSLENKGYLSIVKMKNRDINTGLNLTEKIFNLETLGQKIVWVLVDHEERIKKNEKDINDLRKDNKMLKKALSDAIDMINELKKKVDELSAVKL